MIPIDQACAIFLVDRKKTQKTQKTQKNQKVKYDDEDF
jgi:hypothetical protein